MQPQRVQPRSAQRDPQAWTAHLEFLLRQRHFEAAAQLIEAELAARPRSLPAWRMKVLLALSRADDWNTARQHAQTLTRLAPGVVEHHWWLGLACKGAGDAVAALAAYRRALAIDARHVGAWVSLGILHRLLGQYDEAVRCYRRALALKPDLVEAKTNLGNVLMERERASDPLAPPSVPAETISAQREALALEPDNAAVAANLAASLEHAGDIEEAISLYNRALGADPERQDWLLRLGGCLTKARNPAAVVALYTKWMESHPESAVVASNLALALLETQDLAAALDWSAKAIVFDADFGGAHLSRASALLRACEAELAVAAYRRALALSPAHQATARSGLLMALNYVEEAPEPLFQVHREFGDTFAAVPRQSAQPRSRHGRKLRIGYLSADFKQHSVAWFIESLLAHQDRTRFEIVCYHNTYASDQVTERFRGHADVWVDCFSMTDAVLARRIGDDGIDILIELSGHTHGHRLAALAGHPAPVQITYLGYPTTSGLAAIDYRLTDARIDPPGDPVMNVEKPLRCPASMFCYRGGEAPEPGLPPSLRTQSITFGSFNNGTKLSDHTLALWARVLAAMPEATLFLKTQAFSQESVRERVRERMRAHGIDAQRVRFDPWQADKASHLELYREIDVALDTFPYNGATTTCEALWMGVPVVSMQGRTHVSRMGASILAAAGHAEWVSSNEDDFVAIACALAQDRAALSGFRARARVELAASALMDGARFARDVEALLVDAWDESAEPRA